MKPITKSLFFKTLDCAHLGWHLYRNLVTKNNSVSDEFLVFEAKNIHSMAKLLFPDGVRVSGNLQESIEQTKKLVADKTVNAIFEPVFEYEGFIAKADIIVRNENKKWKIIEVKSGNKWKNKYISDISYISLIFSKFINISKVSMLLLSKDFRIGKPIDELFTETDCSFEVFTKAEEYNTILADVKKTITDDTCPESSLKLICKNCDMFNQCTGKDISYHIFDLPRLSNLIFEKLKERKVNCIKDIPDDIYQELTPMQQNVKNCVCEDKIFVSPNLKTELDKIVFPAYYLDFESVMTIYPLYDNVAPHTQIITQYSIHKCNSVGNVSEHFEYIADHKKNCQKTIAENLVKILKSQGSIITYSSFEQQAVKRFAEICPELTEELNLISSRIVDLEAILKNNYYDKNFHGRTSIKKVLPVMIEDMNYDKLEIGEGGSALSLFAYMAMGMFNENKIEEIKSNLLKYCRQDTLALVKMHKFLSDVCGKNYSEENI